jgi:hypothetical protein
MGATGRGVSGLYIASQLGRLEVVQYLSETWGRELVMMSDNNGWLCLHAACWKGHLPVVQYLSDTFGKELVMITDNDGRSCLYTACWIG